MFGAKSSHENLHLISCFKVLWYFLENYMYQPRPQSKHNERCDKIPVRNFWLHKILSPHNFSGRLCFLAVTTLFFPAEQFQWSSSEDTTGNIYFYYVRITITEGRRMQKLYKNRSAIFAIYKNEGFVWS